MKKALFVLVLSVIVVSFVQAQPIQMKLGHFAAESHPGNIASKMFADAVEKRTEGKIKVTIYPNNALGSPPEVLEQNILGCSWVLSARSIWSTQAITRNPIAG